MLGPIENYCRFRSHRDVLYSDCHFAGVLRKADRTQFSLLWISFIVYRPFFGRWWRWSHTLLIGNWCRFRWRHRFRHWLRFWICHFINLYVFINENDYKYYTAKKWNNSQSIQDLYHMIISTARMLFVNWTIVNLVDSLSQSEWTKVHWNKSCYDTYNPTDPWTKQIALVFCNLDIHNIRNKGKWYT